MNFNKSRRVFLKKTTARPSKNVYFAANLSSISTHFPSVLTLSVTLVTAKKQHRCWKACAYACARDCLLTLDTLYRKNICFAMRVCHFTYISKKKVQISAIFSLFTLISMLICLEGDVLGRVPKEVAPRRGVRCDQLSTRRNA